MLADSERSNTSIGVPFNCHPVSVIRAESGDEFMFLSLLEKYGEARAKRLAQGFKMDITRFYPVESVQ